MTPIEKARARYADAIAKYSAARKAADDHANAATIAALDLLKARDAYDAAIRTATA